MVLNKIFKEMKWNLCSLPYIKNKKEFDTKKNKTISRKLYIIIKAKWNLYKFKLKKIQYLKYQRRNKRFCKINKLEKFKCMPSRTAL